VAEASRADGPIIICYDGSDEAIDAVAFAATVFPGAAAMVVTVWKLIVEEQLAGPGAAPPISDPVEANERARTAARSLAREGAQRASDAGLEAEPVAIELVVCGTGRSGVMYALPGSLASSLVQHVSRPVLVVPSAEAAEKRRREFEKERHPVGSVVA
jgi:nucleotide-binding universal stress UspA family protein